MLIFCLLWTVGGCGSSFVQSSTMGSSGPTSASPIFRLLGTAVRQTIGASGGKLEAVLSDGTRIQLTIPSGALNRDIDFTLTPVEVLGQLGLPVQLPIAAKIEPSGVEFVGGANFSVTLPPSLNPRSYQPYIMEDEGIPMHLAAGVWQGQTLSFPLDHLTVPGLSPNPAPNPPYTGQVSPVQILAALVSLNSANPEVRDDLLRQFGRRLAAQGNIVASSNAESACRTWLEEYTPFRRLLQFTTPDVEEELQRLVDPVAVLVIRGGIELVDQKAQTSDNWEDLKPVNDVYLVHAQRNDLDTATNHLDAVSVKQSLGFEFVVENFSSTPQLLGEDDTAQLQFRVGYRLAPDLPIHFDNPHLAAQLDLTGGETSDLREKTVPPNTNLIYNLVGLKPGASEVQGQLTVFFTRLAIYSETIDSEFHPFRFRIPGKLAVSASAHEGPDGARSVTASVRQGRAPLVGGQVYFSVESGAGSIAQSSTTNEQGLATESLLGDNTGLQEIRVSVAHDSQQASALTTFSGQYDGLYHFQGRLTNSSGTVAVYVQPPGGCEGYFQLLNSTIAPAPPGQSVGLPFSFPQNYGAAGGFGMPDIPSPGSNLWLLFETQENPNDLVRTSIQSGILTWERHGTFVQAEPDGNHIGHIDLVFTIPLNQASGVRIEYSERNRVEGIYDQSGSWVSEGQMRKLR